MDTLLWIAYIVCYCVMCSESRNATDLERLYDDLLERYRVVNPGETDISLAFQLLQVEGLNGKTQVLESSGCLNVAWYDARFSWEPDDYGSIGYITIHASKVWVPLIGLKNSVQKVIDPDWREVFPVFVFSEGIVWWSVCAQFASSCTLDMSEFPYDTQRCSLDFGNVLEPADVVNLTMADDPIDLQSFYPSNEFDVHATGVKYIKNFSPDTELTYASIQFIFDLKRKPFYYILNVIVPTVVLALLSSFTFLIPDDSGEKLSCSVSILLAYSVFILILADNTPQTSEHPPILAIYLTTIMSICGINLLIQLLVMNMYHVRPIRPFPRWLKIIRKCFSCFVRKPSSQSLQINAAGIPLDHIEMDSVGCTTRPGNTDSTEALGVAVIKEIRVLSQKVQATEEENTLIDEWKLVADIFNTFFFYSSLFVQIIMVIICYGVVPAVTT